VKRILAFTFVFCAVLGACKHSSSKPKAATTPNAPVSGTAAPPTTDAAAAAFILEEGFEHDVCGVGISVKFIPATSTSSSFDEAVLYGGPINNVPDKIQDHTGDQPLPDNAAKLVQGKTVTVVGHQFTVDSIDTANSKVGLTAHC
jgi:hypothetical protein